MSQSHANIICEVAIRGIRMSPQDSYPMLRVDEWRSGRADACAALLPTVETLSARNEARFLVSYNLRHGVYRL